MTIDAVILWVDGNDPALVAKHRQYGDPKNLVRDDIGGSTRFSDLGEIHWCVASINRFAPFIRRIFIITDNQDPHVESRIPVEIVDHKVIFAGYEEYLPVFNSNSIEMMMCRVPGLSENFILFNDDTLLVKPVSQEDFFTAKGFPVCIAKKYSSLWTRFLFLLSYLKCGYHRATLKRVLLNGASLAGNTKYFLYLVHTPKPFIKSVFDKFYEEHPDALTRNLKYRFRDSNQWQCQSLAYEILNREGRLVLTTPKDKLLFFHNWRGVETVSKRLVKTTDTPAMKFACFNSLDQASEEERKLICEWVAKTLSI